eukprot:TRINITY_DN2606_c0_g1_i1.p1 TRINITY_DN2606_c0_g1~~TRINITY_DN2606_c0_g1_i1.p1  ORF type:complete len:101 (-),score=5.67 TRINITY_DN2606_c0_g1_i1:764-1066(-)
MIVIKGTVVGTTVLTRKTKGGDWERGGGQILFSFIFFIYFAVKFREKVRLKKKRKCDIYASQSAPRQVPVIVTTQLGHEVRHHHGIEWGIFTKHKNQNQI